MKNSLWLAGVMAICASTVIPGCAMQSGAKFDTAYADQIERGKTTKAEVRAHLGKPVSITIREDGEVWSYVHQQGQDMAGGIMAAFGGSYSIKSEGLTVIFSGDTVKDFTYTKSE